MKKKVMLTKVLMIAATLLVVCAQMVYAQVPGFQGTVNNYGVGMNPDEGCRHPANGRPACSQWFRFKFQAFNDGTVKAPFTITNDSARGYCAAAKFVVKDGPSGNVLGTFVSPRYCIQGKGQDTNWHERRADVEWTFHTDPAVGRRGGDLYGVGVDYEDTGLNLQIFTDVAGIVAAVVKVAEAVIPAAAAP